MATAETSNLPGIVCVECRQPLPAEWFGAAEMRQCPACATAQEVHAFPALVRQLATGASAEAVMTDGEAGCFYHPGKRAAVPCGVCGRFLCALCDVELSGAHYCPVCLETGRKKTRQPTLENQRTRYDRLALVLATVPMLLFWPSLLAAPAAVYVACRYWKSPPGLVVRWRRLSFVLALVLGVAQMIGWGFFFYMLATGD